MEYQSPVRSSEAERQSLEGGRDDTILKAGMALKKKRLGALKKIRLGDIEDASDASAASVLIFSWRKRAGCIS